jgi:hypothetical protein
MGWRWASAMLLVLSIGGCGAERPVTTRLPLGEEPAYGDAADGTEVMDAPDFDCRVVLREVGRIPQGPGFATTCDLGTSDGSCDYVWRGLVDVDALEAESGASVEVLFRTSLSGEDWYIVTASPVEGGGKGFARFEFLIDELTPSAGMSFTSLNQTTIDLVPYLVRANGQRLFDHNRVSHPFGNYELRHGNGWAIGGSAACSPLPDAPGEAHLQFGYPDVGPELVEGPATAGGTLRLTYDGRRLRNEHSCLGSQGPVSSTSLHVGWTIDGGAAQTQMIEQYTESYGYACQGTESPCINIQTTEAVLELPPGSQQIELWFYCVPGFSAGSPDNWQHDSNMGSNYSLAIAPGEGEIDWAGGWQRYAGRSSFTFDLPEPLTWSGFTNMGWCVQARVYKQGLTDQPEIDDHRVKAYVESDLTGCFPGGPTEVTEIGLVATHQGPYGSDSLYRWCYEANLMNCPAGNYRYRFLFSADGGQTFTALGNAESTYAPASATTWRTLISQ